jgi:outer membrane murein-binding lipoprotein Lpp
VAVSIEQLLWLNGVLFAVITALLGVVWHQLGAKIDGIQASVDELDRKHDGTHERVAQVEVQVQATKEKVADVDGRRHRYQASNDDALRKLQQWITERVLERLKP